MITLFRTIRLWQLKIKWKLALMQFLDQQLSDLTKNPQELEKKFVDAIAELIHRDPTASE